nr:sialidase family protein [Candidatus Sigynarchaeum springense]
MNRVDGAKLPDAGNPGRPWGWRDFGTVLLAAYQILIGIIFSYAGLTIFTRFQGELLFLHDSTWAVYVTVILVPASGAYALLCGIVRRRFITFPRGKRAIVWNAFWSIWNLCLGAGAIALAFYLSDMFEGMLVIGGSLLGWDIMLFTIPVLFSLGALLAGTSVSWLVWVIVAARRVRREVGPAPSGIKLANGLVGLGGAFLFLFAVIGATLGLMAAFPAQFAPGVWHVPVFSSADIYTGHNGSSIDDFRIPAMVVMPNDTLMAFAEGRQDVLSDWGNIDIVMKRSTDGGLTWGPLRILAENPQGRLTAGNMVPVYDAIRDNLHVLYNWDNTRLFHVNSSDRGLTWSAPQELTATIGLDGSWHGCGPGVGIQKKLAPHAGRLVVPAYGGGLGGSHVIYSDDGGLTWQAGAGVGVGSEDQVFEGLDGSLCLNMRAGSFRLVAWSGDGGDTWGPAREDLALPDVPCMASVYRMTDNVTYHIGRVLYCGTDKHVRAHYTVRMSYDDGRTWPVAKEVYPGPSAYGQLVVLGDNETIALLVEAGPIDYRGTIHLARFDLHWLTGGLDALDPY